MSATVTLPFVGGEMSSFDPADSNTVEVTTAGTYDPSFARCSIRVLGSVSYANSPLWAAAGTFWDHAVFSLNLQGGSSQQTIKAFMRSGVNVLEVRTAINGTFTELLSVYTLQSGVMTLAGSFSIDINTLYAMDIKLVAGGSGSVTVYMSGTQRFTATGLNHSGFTGVDQIQIRGQNVSGTGSYCCWSELICDTVPHIGDRLRTYPIDTASAVNTGFTGSVSNIDEIVYNDATFVFATANGQISTYYASGFSLGTYNIASVGVAARAQCGLTGPQNMQIAIRVGATNFMSSTIALAVGYQACTNVWTTNPHAGAVWVASTAQAIEGGMEAIT